MSGYSLLSGRRTAEQRPGAHRHEAMGREDDAGDRPARHLRQAQPGFRFAGRRQHHPLPAAGDPGRRQRRRLRLPAGSAWRPAARGTRAGHALLHRGGEFRSRHRHGLFDFFGRGARPVRRYRPRQRAAPQRADLDHLQHAAGAARLSLCQQLHDHGPGLPGQCPGRPGLPPHARRHIEDLRPQHDRRDGAAARHSDGQDRAATDVAWPLQPVHRGDHQRNTLGGLLRPARRWRT